MSHLHALWKPLYSTTRSFHVSRISLERLAWNRKLLQKTKKVDLIRMAEAFQVDKSGQKPALISRLLKCQPPPPKYVLEKESAEKAPEVKRIEKESIPTPTKQKEDAVVTKLESADGCTEDDMNQQWVDAFDKKVVYRGARTLKGQDTLSSPATIENVHTLIAEEPIKDVLKKESGRKAPEVKHIEKESILPPMKQKEDTVVTNSKGADELTEDDMNQQWVDAFDKKVVYRGARTLKGQDTLSPPAAVENVDTLIVEEPLKEEPHWQPETEQLSVKRADQLSQDRSEKQPTEETENRPEEKQLEKRSEVETGRQIEERPQPEQEQEAHSNSSNEQKSSRNILLNSLVGSSILLWLTTGEDGLKTVISSLTSL
ncbi:hypothetical protein DFQ28_005810 [Apophysomyces sp. BC1034]|nr:hypothetical protein DFQ30_005760 [Apophysomyces sp. BC1015]KAG0187826.1 hypothetical protein DFQ28_005810 [Apophysomyces sp. BC1034]